MLKFLKKPAKLYKYLSKDGAQALFDEPALWFSLPNKLNDVYDLRPVGSHVTDFGAIGLLCLSETPVSAPMWAHYASNGEGVVLEFSIKSGFFESYPPKKVIYLTKRPTVKDERTALVSKNIEWSYEREWRCFTSLSAPQAAGEKFISQKQVVSVPFPFEALSAIIHGHDGQVDATKFLALPQAAHVRELVCRLNAWSYGFNLRALNNSDHLFEQQQALTWGQRQRWRK